MITKQYVLDHTYHNTGYRLRKKRHNMIKKKYIKEITFYTLQEMLDDEDRKAALLRANQPADYIVEDEMKRMTGDMESVLEQMGFENAHISYDVSCNQGSGASFIFTALNWKKFIIDRGVTVQTLVNNQEYSLDPIVESTYKEIQEFFQKSGFEETLHMLALYNALPNIEGRANSLSNHYCHVNTVDILDENTIYSSELPTTLQDKDIAIPFSNIMAELADTTEFSETFSQLVVAIRKHYKALCSDIYATLRDEYNSFFEPANIIAGLKEEEIPLFTENGVLYDLAIAPDLVPLTSDTESVPEY